MRGRAPALPFIVITVLLDMIGIGLIIPVLPKLVTSLSGGGIGEGSTVFGLFVASYALMQFLFSPLLGNVSDAVGRRPVILVSLAGSAIDYFVMTVAPSLPLLFAGRIVSGITGANIAAAQAYIADVTPPEQRARNFGIIGACFGAGFILGPALGGLLAGFGQRAPFLAAAILASCNALYGFFVLPESHPRECRRPLDWGRSNPLSSLTGLKQYPAVLGLVGTFALDRLAHDALPSTWVLYMTYKFQWSELQLGLSLALVGLVFGIVQGVITGRFVDTFGERTALIFALCLATCTYLMYALVPSSWMIYGVIVLSGLSGVGGPSMQSLITSRVPSDRQGALQGALSSVGGLMAIFGPLIATNLFALFISDRVPVKVPGAPFIASSVLVAIAATVAVWSTRKRPAGAD